MDMPKESQGPIWGISSRTGEAAVLRSTRRNARITSFKALMIEILFLSFSPGMCFTKRSEAISTSLRVSSKTLRAKNEEIITNINMRKEPTDSPAVGRIENKARMPGIERPEAVRIKASAPRLIITLMILFLMSSDISASQAYAISGFFYLLSN